MCVTIDTPEKPTKKVVTVYKVVGRNTTSDYWTPWALSGRFKRGVWNRAQNPTYAFNCFRAYRGARYMASDKKYVVKCKARMVEGYGRHNGSVVVFAREILLPRGK